MGDRRLPAQHTVIILAIEFPFLPLTFDLCLVVVALTSLTGSVTEKGVNCRRLKDQLDTLERETTDKLAQMEQYNKELQVSGLHRSGSGCHNEPNCDLLGTELEFNLWNIVIH